MLNVGGEKIGIVSALAMDTPETASPGPSVIFTDDMESLKADAQALTDQGVNKIIALTHSGYRRDQEFAAEVPGIDAVIGGHSHYADARIMPIYVCKSLFPAGTAVSGSA